MTSYNFYDYLVVDLQSTHRGYRKYFDNEYARISRGEAPPSAPRIAVQIVDRQPEPEPGDIRHRLRFKNLFTFHFVVRGLETRTPTIFFKQHWVDRVYMNAIGVYLQAQVLEPIMYLKLLEEGILFMHAGGVTKDGKAILLPAYGGTGKTTLSVALLNQGHKLLGDDLLLVDIAAGVVHPYPRPLHIFTYNVRHLRGATIPFKYRFAVYAKQVLRFPLQKILRTELLISTRVHADELFAGDVFGASSPFGAIAFLRKTGPAIETVKIAKTNVDEVADAIGESADLNDSLETLVGPRSDRWKRIVKLEHDVIVSLLIKRGLIAYVNTRVLDLDNLDDFSNRILDRPAA
ncbi:hypothetical protein BH09ACT4_BH09ACT4_01570 [soil metagenome]